MSPLEVFEKPMAGSVSECIPPVSLVEMRDIAIVLRGSTHPDGEEVDAACARFEGSGLIGLRLAVVRSSAFKEILARVRASRKATRAVECLRREFQGRVALLDEWTNKLEHEISRVTAECEMKDDGSEAYGIAHEWYNQEVRALNPTHMETVKESGERLREACRTAEVADTDGDHGTEVLNHAAARLLQMVVQTCAVAAQMATGQRALRQRTLRESIGMSTYVAGIMKRSVESSFPVMVLDFVMATLEWRLQHLAMSEVPSMDELATLQGAATNWDNLKAAINWALWTGEGEDSSDLAAATEESMDQAWRRFAAEAGEWLRILVRTAEADTNKRKDLIAPYKMVCAKRFIEKTGINT